MALESFSEKGEVLFVIAHQGFRDEEYAEPRSVLEKAGYKVTVASSKPTLTQGMLGMQVQPDTTIEQVNVAPYQAVVFIGGSGSSEYWDNPIAHQIAKEAHQQGKVVGAICIAPLTLARAGLLSGKKACGFSSILKDLARHGAQLEQSDVVIDERIVTAIGPSAASAFGQKLVETLEAG
jgi:protease I